MEVATGRVPVIAGAGSNNTAEAVDLARHAAKGRRGRSARRHALLQQAKPARPVRAFRGRSRGDFDPADYHLQHPGPFDHRHDAGDDGRAWPANYKNIVGVKDATGKIERVSEQRMTCGQDFIQLSGEDASALGFNAHGGVGCISVTSNVAPRLCSRVPGALPRRPISARR